jgi:hypothetical protein
MHLIVSSIGLAGFLRRSMNGMVPGGATDFIS